MTRGAERRPDDAHDHQAPSGPAAKAPTPPQAVLFHLTEGELAQRWRVSPRTLERWRTARKGPPGSA